MHQIIQLVLLLFLSTSTLTEHVSWLSLRVRTKQPYGVLAHVTAGSRHCTVALMNKIVQVEYGHVSVRQDDPDVDITDGNVHTVSVDIVDGHVHLNIDTAHSFISAKYHLQHIDDFDVLYIGGCITPSLQSDEDLSPSLPQCFQGCIDDIRHHGHVLEKHRIISRTIQNCDKIEREREGEVVQTNERVRTLYTASEVVVSEGGTVLINTQHIYVYPQHERYALDHDKIVMRLVAQPAHGKLTNENELITERFTYSDLKANKINYTHDGSDTSDDTIEFEVQLSEPISPYWTPGDNLWTPLTPQSLNSIELYALPIRITPVNDPPTLRLMAGARWRVAEHSRAPIDHRHLLIHDPDDTPNNVWVKVIYSSQEGARFEYGDVPGRQLDRFTQNDLITGRIRISHATAKETHLQVAVTDGKLETPLLSIWITGETVRVYQSVNSGLRMLHHTSEVITNQNLTFATNYDLQSGNEDTLQHAVSYRIVDMPEHGFLELRDDSDRWWYTSMFNQTHIDQMRLRYNHSKPGKPPSDRFRFTVSSFNHSSTSMIYDFKITFVIVNIKVFNPNAFILNNTRESTLTKDNLFAWSFPKSTVPEQTIYVLTQAPKYGVLYRIIDRVSGRNRRIGQYANFTQDNINDGDIFYRLHQLHYAALKDTFRFKVVTPHVVSDELTFDVTFLPGEGGIKLINNTLIVTEGRLQQISRETLWLETANEKQFTFRIEVEPAHGDLHVMSGNVGASTPLKRGGTFTTEDILHSRLYYRHDDSESPEDRINIIATSSSDDVEVPIWLHIRVVLVNDHKPRRVHNETFHVVIRGERTITQKDLSFTDDDSGTDIDALQYHIVESTEAAIYRSALPSVRIFNFTQRDLMQSTLLLRHIGNTNFFAMTMLVSDGELVTQERLFVNASSPFMRERENTGLIVRPGSLTLISATNLTVDTNLNMDPRAITYEVLNSTRVWLMLDTDKSTDGGRSARLFTQHDIDNSHVMYVDDINEERRDEYLKLRVVADNLQLWLTFRVLIRSEKEYYRLNVFTAPSLTVSQRGMVEISTQILNTTRRGHLPANVVYYVTAQPRYGNLVLDRRESAGDHRDHDTAFDNEAPTWMQPHRQLLGAGSFYVPDFTQHDVDTGALHYMHAGPDMSADSITLNVTAGDAHQSIVLPIAVVKNLVTVYTSNMTAAAGGRTAITSQFIRAQSTFYTERAIFEYNITQRPKYGRVSDVDGKEVTTFRSTETSLGLIFYEHDGTASWTDTITLVAMLDESIRRRTGGDEAKSEPQVLNIKIMHENRAGPSLLTHKRLQMWTNRVAAITEAELMATDPDSSPEQLLFHVSDSSNGYVAFTHAPSNSIATFTQLDVNNGRVVFVRYPNGTNGGFSFIVDDGRHQLAPRWFEVQASQISVVVEANARLQLAPGQTKIIGTELLRSNIANTDASGIVYKVKRPPRLGKLLIRGVESDIFTQLDINQNQLSYSQSERLPPGWLQRDNFHFIVSAAENATDIRALSRKGMVTEEGRFRISITYAQLSPDTIRSLVQLHTVYVPHGGEVVINATHVNMTLLSEIAQQHLVMRVRRLPAFGTLQYAGRNMSVDSSGDSADTTTATTISSINDDYSAELGLPTTGKDDHHDYAHTHPHESRITQMDIVKQMLTYIHNPNTPTDTPQEDYIKLQIFPTSEQFARKKALVLDIQLYVHVIMPVEVQRFEVLHFRRSIELVRGMAVTLTAADFEMQRSGVRASDVTYSIEQPCAFTSFIDPHKGKEIARFTQSEVTSGIRMQHRVTNDSTLLDQTECALTLRVTAAHRENVHPVQKIVRIKLLPLTLSLVTLRPLTYRQGTHWAPLTRAELLTDSNGQESSIIYEVIRTPENGSLLWVATEKKAHTFTQEDIDQERIIYNQENAESYRDSLTFRVHNVHNNIGDNKLEIVVVPALQQRDVTVSPGGSVLITKHVLDASEIEQRQPNFLVIRAPLYGRLVRLKVDRNRRSSNEENSDNSTKPVDIFPDKSVEQFVPTIQNGSSLSVFSFDDIKRNAILYENTLTKAHKQIDDSFEYELRADGIQPARGTFIITIKPSNTSMGFGERVNASTPKPPPSEKGGMPWLPNITNNYMILVYAVAGIIFIAVVFIIVRRARIQRLRERRYVKQKQAQLLNAETYHHTSIPSPTPDLLGTIYASAPRHNNIITNNNNDDDMAYTGSPRTGRRNMGVNVENTNDVTSGYASTRRSTELTDPRMSPSTRQTNGNMITFDTPLRQPTVTKQTSPICKVTPLAVTSGHATSGYGTMGSSYDDFLTAYQYSSSDTDTKLDRMSLDRATGQRKKIVAPRHTTASHYASPTRARRAPTKLNENQYWV